MGVLVTHRWRRWRVVVALMALLALGIARLDQGTGVPAHWTVPVGRQPVAIAVVGRNGNLLIADRAEGTVRLLDVRSRTILATTALGHSPVALSVDRTTGRVFTLNVCLAAPRLPQHACAEATRSLSILDPESGTLVGTIPLDDAAALVTTDAGSGQVVVATDGTDTLSMVDPNTGTVRAMVDLGGEPQAMALAVPLPRLLVNVLNPVNERSSVCLVDARTGALLRRVPVGRYAGTLLADGRAGRALVSSNGDLYLLDARTGRLVHRIVGGGVPVGIDERAGRALIERRGRLRLIATDDGTTVRAIPLRGTVGQLTFQAVAVDNTTGRFYIATATHLLTLDEHTGRVRGMLVLAQPALALTVDARRHRLFIASGPGPNRTTHPPSESPLAQWLRHTLPWFPLPPRPPTTVGGTVTILDTTRL